jgi:DNA mismatch repair ATPase MutS
MIWDSVIKSISEFDSIISLLITSRGWGNGFWVLGFIRKYSTQILQIEEMSHPLIPERCPSNNIGISSSRHVLLLTGPNDSGKSTYARMCCVAIILAQIGCFLSAKNAHLTVYDKIFTRIGAGDRVFRGQSTFSVEFLKLLV